MLDGAGYTEAGLQTAWRETTNQDVAASIIGFIRRAAVGDPLVPYGERVDRRAENHPWQSALDRPAAKVGSIASASSCDRRSSWIARRWTAGQFKTQGGFNRINKLFDGKLETVLGDLHEALWKSAA